MTQTISSHAKTAESGLSARWGILLIFAATIGAAFAEAALQDTIGMWTGIALAGSTLIASVLFRAEDRSLAIITPPLAFLTATLTAGQLLVSSSSGDVLIKQALLVFSTLSLAAPWVIGSTAMAGIVVLIRKLMDR